jgi:hypothetical protein
MVTTFFEALSNEETLSASIKSILWDLYRLFALNTMENEGYECKIIYEGSMDYPIDTDFSLPLQRCRSIRSRQPACSSPGVDGPDSAACSEIS